MSPHGNGARGAETRTPRKQNAQQVIATSPVSQLDRLIRDAIASGRSGLIAGPWEMAAPKQLRSLMGPPVSRSKQRKLGIGRFVVGIGYQKRPCSRCQQHMWLGPKQLIMLAAEPETELVCTACVLPELQAGLKDGTIALRSLGGRGPGYYMANGHYYGPPEELRN